LRGVGEKLGGVPSGNIENWWLEAIRLLTCMDNSRFFAAAASCLQSAKKW
jgi:hypothetical protein